MEVNKRVYQRSLDEKKFVADSVHSDGHVQKLGYPGALVSAYVITGYINELMLAYAGPAWMTSGHYRLKFIGRGIQQGNDVVCDVKPAADTAAAGAGRTACSLTIRKSTGELVMVGDADFATS